ncbi:hypothetical protein JGH11_10705 [Dysgonomonas sp. Marseille-P4677]|uniref:lipid-binding protein n=1 Tax=Dysgonomonas sp. Marseille-P4677 TaxID=2364790 RepID=UPI0019120B22|nr:lipid-binding protein [Dysgonomonas sp. Marseille-P4677]MBK5721342.1 hypothetical protein [Dysgonomonas sp. Marseille-P4677]
MKQIRYIPFLLLLLVGFISCETYGDYEIEYSSIHPLGGKYRVVVKDETGAQVYKNYCEISNTTNESTTQCWLRIGAYSLSGANAYSINGKINCDLKTLTFSGTNIENLAGNVATSTNTFTLTDGKVTLQGATAPSGTVADAISFTFTNSRFPGKTYTVEGYRYTGWSED